MIRIITTDNLSLRNEPGGLRLDVIPEGTVFIVEDHLLGRVGDGGQWIPVSYRGLSGVANGEYFALEKPETIPGDPYEPTPGSPVTWDYHMAVIDGYKATVEKQDAYIKALEAAQETLRKIRVVLSEAAFND